MCVLSCCKGWNHAFLTFKNKQANPNQSHILSPLITHDGWQGFQLLNMPSINKNKIFNSNMVWCSYCHAVTSGIMHSELLKKCNPKPMTYPGPPYKTSMMYDKSFNCSTWLPSMKIEYLILCPWCEVVFSCCKSGIMHFGLLKISKLARTNDISMFIL